MSTRLWKEWSKTLKHVLGLKGSPVSVSYSIEPGHDPSPGKHWVCQAIKDARDGKAICLTKENSACPGGSTHLGFSARPSGKEARVVKIGVFQGRLTYENISVSKILEYIIASSRGVMSRH